MADIIEQILARQSCPKLTEPAPAAAELEQVLRCGMKAPDHGRLKPWRFVVLTGQARNRLGQQFLEIKLGEDPDMSPAMQKQVRDKPLRAPMIIVAIAEPKEHPKVPAIEQVVAVGCGVQNMQLALASLGYGAMWRTGGLAFHPQVKAFFGADEKAEIVGFLYVGTPNGTNKPPETQQVADTTEFWTE